MIETGHLQEYPYIYGVFFFMQLFFFAFLFIASSRICHWKH